MHTQLALGKEETAAGLASTFRRLAAATIVVVLFLLAMLWLGGAALGIREVSMLAAGTLIVVLSGELLLALAGLTAMPAHIPIAAVAGAVTTSLVLLAGVVVTGFGAGAVFLA